MTDKLTRLIERLNAWRTAPVRVKASWLAPGQPVKLSTLATATVPVPKK